MSRNTNDELPDDLIDKLKFLNEQPDDYDADTRPLVPLDEEDIGTFRPPEPALRVGVRDSSYLNIALGDISVKTSAFCFQTKAKSTSKWMKKRLVRAMQSG